MARSLAAELAALEADRVALRNSHPRIPGWTPPGYAADLARLGRLIARYRTAVAREAREAGRG